ncbi:hypothetical protein BBX43_24070 [Enterobacter roggenkampii]|nr:hypothetical protein BBX43_24070 [Enterobacter roggenkampii]
MLFDQSQKEVDLIINGKQYTLMTKYPFPDLHLSSHPNIQGPCKVLPLIVFEMLLRYFHLSQKVLFQIRFRFQLV